MRHLFTPKRLACALLTLSSASLLHAAETNTTELTAAAQARNVILIIGDGMDTHQISSARSYLVGSQADMLLDTMPVRGAQLYALQAGGLAGSDQFLKFKITTPKVGHHSKPN